MHARVSARPSYPLSRSSSSLSLLLCCFTVTTHACMHACMAGDPANLAFVPYRNLPWFCWRARQGSLRMRNGAPPRAFQSGGRRVKAHSTIAASNLLQVLCAEAPAACMHARRNRGLAVDAAAGVAGTIVESQGTIACSVLCARRMSLTRVLFHLPAYGCAISTDSARPSRLRTTRMLCCAVGPRALCCGMR